jgi:amidase
MHLRDYVNFDGLGLAELVRRREVKPEELVQVALSAIEAVNPSLNAVIGVWEAEARATLAQALPEGPFAGVPFLVKDLVLHLAGVPTDMGSRLFQGLMVPYDTALMERYRRAGVVTLGRTNTPELGFNASTEPVLHGPTRNPWNPEFSVGGSSGGSAAAVSAGIVPVAYANDGAGSIRIPASLCGLFGMKPTRGRTPSGPNAREGLNGLGVEHVVSRSVRDSAAMLDATLGPDVGDSYGLPSPERPYLEEVKREPGRLRIAFTHEAPTGATVSPECVAAVEDAARLCRELGHEVVEVKLPLRAEPIELALRGIWSSALAAWVDGMASMFGRTPGPDMLEASVWATVLEGREVKAVELQRSFAIMNHLSREMGRFFLPYDALITPTLPVAPYRLGVLNANAPTTAQAWARQAFSYCAFTAPFNLTGQPAMSMPLHWSAEGLPVGVQFVGRFADEATLFRLAGQIERARPWAHRTPPIHAASARGRNS